MSKHTPGPWHFNPRRIWSELECITDSQGQAVARANLEANARLISAAPDLLDALKWAYEVFPRPEMTELHAAEIACALAQIKKAIAKAEGEEK